MGDICYKKEPRNWGDTSPYVLLTKDRKTISRTQCINPPCKMPAFWSISDIVKPEKIKLPSELPFCTLLPAAENCHQEKEWGEFLGFLQKTKKVAIGKLECYEFYILPPSEGSNLNNVTVIYKEEKGQRVNDSGRLFSPRSMKPKVNSKLENAMASRGSTERNYVQVDPSYLKTLGQAHSGWIFGAIAEFVDNSRDAKATKLEISISMVYSKTAGKVIPMLSIIDDGHGMKHQEIVRMISFGHKQHGDDDLDRIGRFGIGFKTGAMRLGKDALVLTQAANSRSIAFLSQTLNEGKDNLEIPIVSYRRIGQFMEIDTSVQDEGSAKYNLKAIKEYSPFNKYLIGEKAGLFNEKGTGTQIYIWNLDEWGSNYSLHWETGMIGGSSFHQGDILIRSRRIRSRPGQMSQMVPLDYSLKSYLEVIFLDPRMKIYVQGAPVKTRPLAKSLRKTVVKNGEIMGKPVQLILGRCQLEWEQANCGIFLYWHGRLIEAYKRVGSMIHNGDNGRGIIGVIDLTELMKDDNGHVWVHNNKQGFQDCEAYAELEKWLGIRTDEYLDKFVNKLQLEKAGALDKPDHEWVQCDKCRKWRMLAAGFNCQALPPEWFCYMKPFNGRCDLPEQKVEDRVVTVSVKRSGYSYGEDSIKEEDWSSETTTRGSSDNSSQIVENDHPSSIKRCRRGPARSCKTR